MNKHTASALPRTLAWDEYLRLVHGAWLGKTIGSTAGAPLEGRSAAQIWAKHGRVDRYVAPVTGEEVNDDQMYQVVALHALETHGPTLTSRQLAQEWLDHLEEDWCHTAERVAYRNLRAGHWPPESARVDNEYAEWVGGQMKADIWGLLAPLSPDVAARYARLDGEIAHTGIGIEGEIFEAALVAHLFAWPTVSVTECVEAALAWLPAASEYRRLIADLLAYHRRDPVALRGRDWVLERAAPYHSVHVIPNALVNIFALLYGNGDFDETLALCLGCGLDTDTNGQNTGALLGVMLGADGIPPKWAQPLRGQFRTQVKGMERWKITDLAERTAQAGWRLLQHYGAHEEKTRTGRALHLPEVALPPGTV